ncbi:MAG: type II toxin-antitoxin system RelE/ParE family toxin [Patescibacteria group bacterium]
MYTFFLSPKSKKFLDKMPRDLRKRIDNALILLRDGKFREARVTKLVGSDLLRKRVGDYRIIFEIDNKKNALVIFRIGNRKDVYK